MATGVCDGGDYLISEGLTGPRCLCLLPSPRLTSPDGACFTPFIADVFGAPTCDNDDYYPTNPFGCLEVNATKADCTALGGTWIEYLSGSQAECNASPEACFDGEYFNKKSQGTRLLFFR